MRPSARAFRNFAIGVLAYNFAVVAWGAFVRASGSGAWLFLLAMALEAGFGAMLVKLGLVVDNASPLRAVVMSLHQVVTFYLFGALALTVLWADGLGRIRIRQQGLAGTLLLAALAAMPVLAISGAVAALGDTLFPASSLWSGMQQDLAGAAPLVLRLRTLHPFIAVATCALVLVAAASAAPRSLRARDAAYALAIVFLLQLGAGALNLLLLAPTGMQLVHLALADLTWLALVRLAAVTLAEPAPSADHQLATAA